MKLKTFIMRRFVHILLCIVFPLFTIAQIVENPVFDRTDTPTFHLDKIRIDRDTSYLYFTYFAEDSTWVAISKDTYIEDTKGTRYSLLKAEGIPYSPQTLTIYRSTQIPVTLCFPRIDSDIFNLIESKNENAFNIYGINLKNHYDTVYNHEQFLKYDQDCSQLDKLGLYEESFSIKTKQLEVAKYLYGIHSYECAAILYDLCLISADKNDSEEVISYGEKAIHILDHLPPTQLIQSDLARIYSSLMSVYIMKDDYEKGFSYGEKSLSLRKQAYGDKDTDYINFLMRLIDLYREYGYSSNAAFHAKEGIKLYKEVSEKDPEYLCDYVTVLVNSIGLFGEANNYEQANICSEEALKIVNNGKCDNEEQIFHVYNSTAPLYAGKGDFEEAIKCFHIAYEAAKRANIDSFRIARSLMSLGNLYARVNKDSLAIFNYEEALKILEKDENIHKKKYLAELYDVLGDIYYKKDIAKSQYYHNLSIEMIGDYYGKESIIYGNALQYRSVRDFWSYLENKQLTNTLVVIYRIIKKYLDVAMLSSTKKERSQLWQKYIELFDWWVPIVTFFLESNEMNEIAYDAVLFYKGYKMNMDNDIKMHFLLNEDDSIQSLYKKYISELNDLKQLYSVPINNRPINIDSLQTSIAEDEQRLTSKIVDSNYKFDNSNLTWKDVREKLRDNEVVVEFISFKSIDKSNGQKYYLALVLNNKLSAPKMIRLFEESNLKQLLSVDTLDYNKISNLVWPKPLIEEIEGCTNLYFSPAGLLNSIGIEYLPISDTESINDKYNIYRISSSKELINRNENIQIKNAALYGDLNYNWKQNKKEHKISVTNNLLSVSRGYVDCVSSRGGFDLLANTKDEINKISKVLSESGIETNKYSGDKGTEESFKQLSGKGVNVIHLATHGLYISQADALQKRSDNNFVFINSENDTNYIIDENSLTRSVLVMAEGNKLLRRDSLSWGDEDGMLTALEISNLDLRNLDLVVLSACQTALGDVDSEGVYGLQRGFKKAGAKSILMSLDNVDDEATRTLMVEFYRNLMKGKTKIQSLKDAQKYLRQVENGKYDKPEYWASFIMLDGLN